jgi:hypothetical protein
MDAESRVVGFLILHESLDFCDECLADRLGLTAERLTGVLALLEKSAPILRDRWTCRSCARLAVVTRAVPNGTFALSRRSRTRQRRPA